MDDLIQRNQEAKPNAAELLPLLSYFDNRSIWYGLVRGCCNSCNSNAPVWFKKTVSNGLAFKTTVRTLIEFLSSNPSGKKEGIQYIQSYGIDASTLLEKEEMRILPASMNEH